MQLGKLFILSKGFALTFSQGFAYALFIGGSCVPSMQVLLMGEQCGWRNLLWSGFCFHVAYWGE